MHTKAVLPVFAATGAVAAIHGAAAPAAPAAPQQPQQQQASKAPVLQPGMIVTKVVDSFVTYCAEPTTFTYAEVPYTALTPGDVTVTNCPCTIETTVDQPGPTGPAGPPPPPPGGPDDECDSCDEEGNEESGPPPPGGPDDECDSCDEEGAGGPTGGVLTITRVVDSFVTYCPQPTVFNWEDHYYTVTTPGDLTVTNCPCTVETTAAPEETGGSGPGGPGGPQVGEECDSGCDDDEEGGESPEASGIGGSSPKSTGGSSPASTGTTGGNNGGFEESPEASGTAPALTSGAGSGSSGSGSGSTGSGSGSSGSGSGAGSSGTESSGSGSSGSGSSGSGSGSSGSGTGEEDESSSLGNAVQWMPTAMPTYVISGAAGRDIAICGTMLAAFLVGIMAM